MFYQNPLDSVNLRLGDILIDQTNLYSNINTSIADGLSNKIGVELETSLYSVVLTPCCAIGDDILDICPLIPINKYWFTNPYLEEDMTRVNRIMNPQQAIQPDRWNHMPDKAKEDKLAEGTVFAFLENFVYDKNDFLKKYKVDYQINNVQKSLETNYYMIDFRHITRIKSKNIKSDTGVFLKKKIAQLSINARSELRDKIGYFYSKPPKEDQITE